LLVIVIASECHVNVATIFHVVGHDEGFKLTVAVGATLSILAIVAITFPVFPATSLKVNVKLPFPVNVWVYVFTPVIVSLRHVNVAITSLLVAHVVEYFTMAVGLDPSMMLLTVAITLPAFPDKSWK